MTDAVDRRYEEAVAEAEKGLASPSQVRSVLDAIGFRRSLEIEEQLPELLQAAEDYLGWVKDVYGKSATGNLTNARVQLNFQVARLRAALAARATAAFIRYYENRD